MISQNHCQTSIRDLGLVLDLIGGGGGGGGNEVSRGATAKGKSEHKQQGHKRTPASLTFPENMEFREGGQDRLAGRGGANQSGHSHAARPPQA